MNLNKNKKSPNFYQMLSKCYSYRDYRDIEIHINNFSLNEMKKYLNIDIKFRKEKCYAYRNCKQIF